MEMHPIPPGQGNAGAGYRIAADQSAEEGEPQGGPGASGGSGGVRWGHQPVAHLL